MRYEFKYLVPDIYVAELRSMLLPFVQPDRFAAMNSDHQYTVRSIYFDTPDFEMYHTKTDHLAHRMKVRLRGYNEGGPEAPVFFEIKRKYEGPIKKNRATLPFESAKRIFAGAPIDDFLPITNKADNIRRFFYQVHKRHLKPVVTVIYEREVYLSQLLDTGNDLRISFDKHLRAVPFPLVEELYDERDIRYPMDGHFILEVKFNHFCPAWIRPILANLELIKTPASKYVMCIDSQPRILKDRKYSHFYMYQRRTTSIQSSVSSAQNKPELC